MEKVELLHQLFREELKKIRLEKKQTQEKFAETAGINEKFYGKVERGKSTPSLTTILKICVGHNISFSEIAKIAENKLNN